MGEGIPHRSSPGRLPASPFSWLAAAGLMLLFAVTGCGKSEMGRVSGRITKNGKPVAGVNVMFYTPNRPVARGKTDADGRYTLSTRRLNDGAYAGHQKVAIETSFNPDGSPHPQAGAVAPNIGDLATTPLDAEVKAGTSNTCDFDLATAKGSGQK
jgi:hypothetical protein